jgi:hypothetical protein
MTSLAASDLTGRDKANLTIHSIEIRALLAIAFLYPVVLCAIFFPTPTYDLREHINLGQTFPFYTWKNPPLEVWLSGIVTLTGARDAWLYVLLAQVITFAGLFYLVLIARKLIGREAEAPLIILFCGSVYYSLAIPSMALNADQIQIPLWAGVLYHGLSAARDDRWRDWILCGVLLGLSLLAKYFAAAMVVVFVLAGLYEPAYRRIFRNVRLYAAGLIAVAIALVHAIPEVLHGDAVERGLATFMPRASLSERLWSLWHLFRSYFLYGLPALIGLAAIARHGGASRPRMPRDPAQRAIVFIGVVFVVVMFLMIVIGGLSYTTRYAFPVFGLGLLALLCVIRIEPWALRPFARVVLALWIAIVAGTIVYAQLAINSVLREPAPAAAAALRAEWQDRYKCGPAYLIGDTRSVWAIAIYYGRGMTGVGFNETKRPDWFDLSVARRYGAIVVTTPGFQGPESAHWLDGQPTKTLTLPYRRTLKSNQHTYAYYLIPPLACPNPADRPGGGHIEQPR